MKFLSPTDYLNWPSFAQRIFFAHNAVPHESLGLTAPFEMDYGAPPVSAFAPPLPLDAPDLSPEEEDAQQLLQPPKVISLTCMGCRCFSCLRCCLPSIRLSPQLLHASNNE
jgi:hypothetical protein